MDKLKEVAVKTALLAVEGIAWGSAILTGTMMCVLATNVRDMRKKYKA